MERMKKVLLLSFYYPPDLSAGSYRIASLEKALRDICGTDTQIDVITTMPNRYKTYIPDVGEPHAESGLLVHRVKLPSHKSGMIDQSKAFATYAREVRQRTKSSEYDLVFATSSRLMTAVLGAHIASRINAPLYLDIRDLFTDTMSDLLSGNITKFLLPVFRYMEKRAFSRANKINIVSEGFL